MNGTKIHRYASLCIISVSLLIFAYFALNYVFSALLPFLIAWALALSLRPLSRKASKLTRVNERLCRLVITILACVLFIALVVGVLWYVVNKSWQFLGGLDGDSEIITAITTLLNGGFFSKIAFGEELFEYVRGALNGVVTSLMGRLAQIISNVAVMLPGVFIFIIVTIISAAYFAYDLEGINAAVKSVLPGRAVVFLRRVRMAFTTVGIRYIRSYFIIMSVTFITLLIGFMIIGVEYAILIALFVAILDILPIFGVGTVLVPWSVVSFVMDDIPRGVGLIILFVFITVLREIVEPKILGRNLGLHPLLTLILLYLGYSFFGFFGMIVLPPLGALLGVMLRPNSNTP